MQACKSGLEAWVTCLEAYSLESEHLLLSLSICDALRSFDVPARRSFGVPSMYGRRSRLCDTARSGHSELVVPCRMSGEVLDVLERVSEAGRHRR